MTFYAFCIINIITFFVYGLDKLKAVNHWWRIPEWVLLGLAAAGGSVGAYLGMMVFRHKTLKPLFRFGSAGNYAGTCGCRCLCLEIMH